MLNVSKSIYKPNSTAVILNIFLAVFNNIERIINK